jgi:hypothetical protein
MAQCSRPQFGAAFIPRDGSAARELMGHHLVDIFQALRGRHPSTRGQRRPSETRQMKERPIGLPLCPGGQSTTFISPTAMKWSMFLRRTKMALRLPVDPEVT